MREESSILCFSETSIGKKILMAVTGTALISFLTAIYFVYVKNKISTGVVFLIVSTFFFKLFQIYLDPFSCVNKNTST